MREQVLSTSSASADPLQGSTDGGGSAMQAVKQAASEVQAGISESIPEVGSFLNRVLYQSSYMLSFGVVFPVMLVVRVVPKNNAIVHGFVDGALAASEHVAGWGLGGITEESDPESVEAEHGSSTDGKPSAETNHRRRGSRRGGHTHATSKRTNRKG